MATYLRLTLGEREGRAPGHIFVVEIWPAGHFSPTHNHSNAYTIIRVLHGEILMKLYPALRHVDLHGTCCIIIQCYTYGKDDRQHYEYFDYLPNDGGLIGHFEPTSDMDFDDFKDLMRQEQINILHASS